MPIPAHLLALNEEQRLQALAKLDVAAALAEPIFQELVAVVAHVYGLPIAFISAVGADQTVFLATHGVPGLRALPREESLCSIPVSQHHTTMLNGLLTASESPHQQTAVKLGLAAYVGAPIIVEESLAVGAFCVSSPVPREFSQAEKQTLEAVADLVSQIIILRHDSLLQDAGQRWQLAQQLMQETVQFLQGLTTYLVGDSPPSLPTSESLLSSVKLRLANLQAQLREGNAS